MKMQETSIQRQIKQSIEEENYGKYNRKQDI